MLTRTWLVQIKQKNDLTVLKYGACGVPIRLIQKTELSAVEPANPMVRVCTPALLSHRLTHYRPRRAARRRASL